MASPFIPSVMKTRMKLAAAAFWWNAGSGREVQLKIWIGITVNGENSQSNSPAGGSPAPGSTPPDPAPADRSSAGATAATDYRDKAEALTGISLRVCPVCHHGQMIVIELVRPTRTVVPIPDTS